MAVPPTSPRLPSPPPVPEIQFGPKSPGMVEGDTEEENMIEKSMLEANSARRIHPGTKAAEMATGPPLVPLGQLDSPFQLQEHLKALHYSHTRPSASHQVPINRESARLIASAPPNVDHALWLYELCRFLISKCNDLIVGFLFDSPPCSASSCPEMRASEWQFLCAVHEQPKSCCAIDYCCHTLDWAANTVTSQKIFPSRLSLGSDDNEDNHAGVKHLTNIFRRLHRIFAHAWFQHREVFWRIEGETGLYVLFKTVCDTYDLLPAENFKLPPEAEGLDSQPEVRQLPRQIMKHQGRTDSQEGAEDDSYKSVGRNNTRRHIRSSPSTGSSVMTVPEADEEETKSMAERLNRLAIQEEEKEPSEAATLAPLADLEVETEAESEATLFVYNEDDEAAERVEADIEAIAQTTFEPLSSEGPESSTPSSPYNIDKVDSKRESDDTNPNVLEDTEAGHTIDANTGAKETPVHKPDLDEQSHSPASPAPENKKEEQADSEKENKENWTTNS